MADEPTGFLGRWSRRKVDIAQGKPLEEPVEKPVAKPAVAAPPASDADATAAKGQTQALEALPEQKALTLADARLLTKDSDFKPFMAGDVTPDVRNAAMKQLFADPHFNVMDGLDTYIDDYSVPSPLPASMLKKMAQARFLGLVTEETDEPPPAVPAPTASATDPLPDEDPDLRLQPHDAAGREGPGPGAGEDPRREP